MPKLAASTCTQSKVDVNMTPMIDVVFQLLTFFLMTFRVASAEGDFQLKLPLQSPRFGPSFDRFEVRLAARPDGDLERLEINGQSLFGGRDVYDRLHREMVRLVDSARSAGLPTPEVDLDADDTLRYEHVIQAVAAISTHTNEHGEQEPLVRKIKFVPK